VDDQKFKEALGQLPTGISIIATKFDNHLFGLTVNSFTSVSLHPPLVSFCLNKNSSSAKAFNSNNSFAVSILAENQANLSKHFASSNYNKFANIQYIIGESSDCPLIAGAICWLECNKLHKYEVGDHIVFVGEVVTAKINNDLKPLIYYARNYWQLR
jgi:flavin reductase (DIM6/NTAB) family NADH-FMN oxidoreductase RutF